MNQILQTEIPKNKKSVEMNKIVIFFGVSLIIFAIILIGLGSYALLTKDKEQENPNVQVAKEAKPIVNLNQEGDQLVIEVTHTKPLSKIVYNWNIEEETEINIEGKTSVNEKISIPFGSNVLKVTVIAEDGEETKNQKEYVLDGDGKPVIELKLTKNNKIKIKVQDTSSLSYMIYKWNDEEEQKIEVDNQTPSKIEKEIEIPMGQNTLKVQATNANSQSTVKELQVKGIRKPTLSFKKEGEYVSISAEDTTGLKVINTTINGQTRPIDCSNKTSIKYKVKLQEGDNTIQITAENQDGGVTTKTVKCKK